MTATSKATQADTIIHEKPARTSPPHNRAAFNARFIFFGMRHWTTPVPLSWNAVRPAGFNISSANSAATKKRSRFREVRRLMVAQYLASLAVDPQWLAFDLEINHRDMVAAKVRDIQLIKVRAAKGAIGGLTKQQVLDVLAKKLDVT
jgi:hypothetical protein